MSGWRYGTAEGGVLDESEVQDFTDEYVYFDGKRVAHRNIGTGAINYYVDDFIGSSRVLTTSAGAACYDGDFYPYGAEKVVTNTCPQNYQVDGEGAGRGDGER